MNRVLVLAAMTLAVALPSRAQLHFVQSPKSCEYKKSSVQQKKVALYGDAAIAYLYEKVLQKGEHVKYYWSRANGRIYYRDNHTHQAFWVTSVPHAPIIVDASKARQFSDVRGYNNRKTGRRIRGYGSTGLIFRSSQSNDLS